MKVFRKKASRNYSGRNHLKSQSFLQEGCSDLRLKLVSAYEQTRAQTGMTYENLSEIQMCASMIDFSIFCEGIRMNHVADTDGFILERSKATHS